jgi:hypothetical protein
MLRSVVRTHPSAPNFSLDWRTLMDETTRKAILSLCDKVEEVVGNGDFPTEDGLWHDDGVTYTCVINDLITEIREGLGAV